ncbi:uncharacterized protein LOC102490643 [Tupaia chinensis]|uniref:uncharacterized protein LOC102490643 n=1 Tax=Tupaia chinensis TaxID=246437 RepID=UPI0003C8F82B|nr:uncharacterized protein LOC102490643 [Tupaia chinensis]
MKDEESESLPTLEEAGYGMHSGARASGSESAPWWGVLPSSVRPPSLPQETKEAWGASRAERPSFDSYGASATSICSFTDDSGYQGGHELTSGEDCSTAQSRSQKRNKVAILQMRRKKMEEDTEDTEDTEDGAEGPPPSSKSPRTKGRQCPCRKTCQLRHNECLSILENSLNPSTEEVKLSCWSLATFYQYFCSCCHRTQKSVEENKASGSRDGKATCS